VRFAAITLCVASQRVFVVVYLFRYRFSPETSGYTLVCNKFNVLLTRVLLTLSLSKYYKNMSVRMDCKNNLH
jgi:hypothetical protein